ncbi:hypothetical protein RND81_12G223400 [Saponaria officinalis]|uniref:Methyltransferase small domain-containing protein n=1 Tax=Saponaria officinalis TaxID=3572 RepID=A0AAW1HDW7_SAPOF
MKASSVLHLRSLHCHSFSTPLISSLFHTKPLHSSSLSSSLFSSFYCHTSSETPHKPKTPIFLKPPIYKTTSKDLNTFINWAKDQISSLGPTFIDHDTALLQRELKWFLDDSVHECPSVVEIGVTPSKEVTLRESLDKMYELWEDRMVKRRPFQYIVGCEHWRDLVLCVEDGVLIPRPETAAIVDLVEGLGKVGGGGGVWADLGTGSGALAIGISRVFGRDARVVATDVSPVAVSVARFNVERYALQDTIDVRQGSWFDPIMEFEGNLTGLVSNPPYIPSEDMGGLQPEVGKHEPWLALDGGVEGLDYLSYLCAKTSTMLKPGGFFAFETNGEKQCKILANYLENMTGDSICNVNIVSDFAGIPRFVTGHRK